MINKHLDYNSERYIYLNNIKIEFNLTCKSFEYHYIQLKHDVLPVMTVVFF